MVKVITIMDAPSGKLYPKLMATPHKNLIVWFTDGHTGTVLISDALARQPGHQYKNFHSTSFKDYPGKVVLENE